MSSEKRGKMNRRKFVIGGLCALAAGAAALAYDPLIKPLYESFITREYEKIKSENKNKPQNGEEIPRPYGAKGELTVVYGRVKRADLSEVLFELEDKSNCNFPDRCLGYAAYLYDENRKRSTLNEKLKIVMDAEKEEKQALYEKLIADSRIKVIGQNHPDQAKSMKFEYALKPALVFSED